MNAHIGRRRLLGGTAIAAAAPAAAHGGSRKRVKPGSFGPEVRRDI